MADDSSKNGNELFLLDGNSLAYRAFFALPESIATADGRPTNAIYGLASMLGKIVVEHKPAGLIAAWDAGMSGREKTYDLYKAQRPPAPRPAARAVAAPDAAGRSIRLHQRQGRGLRGRRRDRHRSAREAREEGIPVMVVSGDRDVYQLVGDGIRVMTTSRGVTETKVYDRDGVIERYGVPPELVTDLIGLKGDTSDNIPGVPGIGEKTGAALLQEFGSLEEVLANVEKISGAKRKQNLLEHADDARVSKAAGDASVRRRDRHRLRRGDGRSARPQHPARVHARVRAAGGDGKARGGPARRGFRSRPQRRDRARGRGGRGNARGPARRRRRGGDRGSNWAAAQGDRIVGGTSTLDELAVALGDRPLTGHDLKSLGGGRHGLLAAAAREGVELHLDHDTMVAAYLLEPQRRTYELTELAADAGIGIAEGAGAPDGGESEDGQLALGEEPEAGLDPAEEARLVAALADAQRPRIEELELTPLLDEVELPLVHVLAAMEREGLKLDAERLAEVGAGFGERIETLESEIFELAEEEFTIGSPQQVGQILFEKLGLTRKRRGKTGFSTDARVLAQIRDEHPIVEKIESWRELSKLKSTYLDTLPELIDPDTGRVHTTFNQASTTTGRLSSTNPNLQNIPIRTEIGRPVRACFVAERGARLLSADYSQVELRVLAHVADEGS